MTPNDFVKRLQGYVAYNSDKNPPSQLQWSKICKDLEDVVLETANVDFIPNKIYARGKFMSELNPLAAPPLNFNQKDDDEPSN